MSPSSLLKIAWHGLSVLFMLHVITTQSSAQAVSINETGAVPAPLSIFDVSSTTKGMLVPRMTTMQRNAIGAGPLQAGMMVYDTDIARYMFFNGTGWSRIGDGLWMEAGAGIQNAIANVGIGTPPTAGLALHVVSPNQEIVRVAAPANALMTFYNGATYSGFIQAFNNDFYFGKNSGAGQVVLFNQGASHLEIDPQGDVGIGISGPVANRLRVEGNVTFPVVASQSNYVGNSDVRAFHGTSIPAPGWGYGGEFIGGYRGVYGYANATTFADNAIGVHGHASGSTGTRTGIYGSATGGTTNWAGYFASGNVYVQNDLRLGDAGGAIGYRFSVDGKIICEELKVQNSAAWPDYVFATDYPLMPIDDLEQHIKAYQHLPGIPSASEVDENGILVGDMQHRMMEKIEELTLYIIAQEKRIRELENQTQTQTQVQVQAQKERSDIPIDSTRENRHRDTGSSATAKKSRSR